MIGFIYRLIEAGIPISVQYVLELYEALGRGLAPDLDRLFLLSRLIFVKRVEYHDAFEQVFSEFFLGADRTRIAAAWEDLLDSKPFRAWLQEQIDTGALTAEQIREFDTEELIARFWETVLAQQGRHEGGHTWVGTRGHSAYGHGGRDPGGLRVYGRGLHGTARKVIDSRRHVSYSERSPLTMTNLHQVLSALRSLRPVGAETELDVDETIARTAKNGGEIELVFERALQNRLKLIVLLDNGGYSMDLYLPLVRAVFGQLKGLFGDLRRFYFHNCIYGAVYRDPPRTRFFDWEKLLTETKSTRLVIFGDANMAPSELMAAYGAMDLFTTIRKPGVEWLRELRTAFPASVWLNPIPKARWGRESTTIRRVGEIFQMEDLTLGGIKNAVSYLNIQGQAFDRQ